MFKKGGDWLSGRKGYALQPFLKLKRPLDFKTGSLPLYGGQLDQTFLNEHNLRRSVCSLSLSFECSSCPHGLEES